VTRWLSFRRDGAVSFGYVDRSGTGVVDASARSDFADLKAALAADALGELPTACGDDADVPPDGLAYLPPVPNPDKILCVGLNYRDHQAETGRGGEPYPTIFMRLASAQVAHGESMVVPRESATLDYEGEIVLVIGRGGRRIPKARALEHVAGFSIYNDGSVREYQRQTSQFTPGKNFDGTGAFGPWMLSRDAVKDPSKLSLTTRLNGEVMQEATAELLVFGFATLVEYCSTFATLMPGDLIVTGTPGGVGAARTPPVFLQPGDRVEVTVEPIGTLSNPVVGD